MSHVYLCSHSSGSYLQRVVLTKLCNYLDISHNLDFLKDIMKVILRRCVVEPEPQLFALAEAEPD
jgi:hypothetical protein